MIARIEIDYSSQERLVKIAEDALAYEVLREVWGGQAPDEKNKGAYYNWPREILIDIETDGPRLTGLGITFQIKNFKGTMPLRALIPETH